MFIAMFDCPTTNETLEAVYQDGTLTLWLPTYCDRSFFVRRGFSEADIEAALAQLNRIADATWQWCEKVILQRHFSSVEETKEYLISLGIVDIDFSLL